MSPASYLTAPPRVAGWIIALRIGRAGKAGAAFGRRRKRPLSARGQACRRERQAVRRAEGRQRSVCFPLPAVDAAGVGVERVQVTAVAAQRLVANSRLPTDSRR